MPSWLSSTVMALLAASGLMGGAGAMQLRQPAAPNYRARGSGCPSTCVEAGPNPANWTAYSNLDTLKICNQTLFYHFSLHDMVDDQSVHRIYACASTDSTRAGARIAGPKAAADPETLTNVTYGVGRWDENAEHGIDLASISQHVRDFLNSGYQSRTPGAEVLYAQTNGSTVGLYIGKAIKSFTTVTNALTMLEARLRVSTDTSGAVAMQLCDKDYDSDHIFGFVATSNTSFTPVQQLMQSWSSADCPTFDSPLSFTGTVTFTTPVAVPASNGTANGTAVTNSTISSRSAHLTHHLHNAHLRREVVRDPELWRRGDCSTVQVASGDSCASLATKCGISGDDFTKYNSGSDFCAKLTPGQHVCCSAGSLPDFAPKQQSNGSCYAYNVVADDNCASIAATYDLTNAKIESFNNKTWGWQGCQNLLLGAVICLSSGAPPMPSALTNAVCGPQKPGTVVGAGGTYNLSSLNPCPLNACCDIWGQCGITSDFCTDTSTGPPGTAKAGTNGCISNCGTDIVKGAAPASYINIAYYEGYGMDRDCLFQDISQLDTSRYTHVHFAFATLDSSYKVDVGTALSAFELKKLIRMTGIHRVLTFGGWAFSTDPSTYTIFREGVTAANREAMATAMADYVTKNGLDGVDIDWEYPGAPDIPGIPAGGKDDGANYLAFLKVLKGKLPNKTVSIAAPSSYWYLKAFLIAEISKVVDYIVFMTYDLHGQWDSDNSWSQEGCAHGNCLRSHVNITETMTSLAMVTKAGVPSNKVVAGVTSYGRSFGMDNGGCYTPECTYGGNAGKSTASKGVCTSTAGYLADAEIYDIISGSSSSDYSTSSRKRWGRSLEERGSDDDAATSSARVSHYYYDKASDSQILVYDSNQWVAFMTSDILESRTAKYKSYNLLGVTNWASDLEKYNTAPGSYSTWDQFRGLAKTGDVPDGSDYANVKRSGNWTSLTCTDLAVSNVKTMTPSQRWNRLDCNDAWSDLMVQWKQDRASKTTFSASMQANLHLAENVDCTQIGGTSQCEQMTTCDDFTESDLGPAAFLIWNSLELVHNMYTNYHDLLHDLADSIFGPSLDLFMDTFAPVVPKDNAWLDILLAVVGLVGTVAASAFFNSILKALPYFRENSQTYDNLKDTAKALVSFGVSATGAYVSGPQTAWTKESQDDFKATMGLTIDSWDTINTDMLAQLFDGSDSSLDILWSLISDGKLVEGKLADGGFGSVSVSGSQDTNNTMRASIEGGFYGMSIPAVWRKSGKAVFIMDMGTDCNGDLSAFLSDDDAKAARVCIDNKLYALGYPKGGASKNCDEYGVECQPTKFKLPTGFKQLDGSAWGGVTLEKLVRSSVLSYTANGNKNGGAEPDISNSDTVSDILATIDGDSDEPSYVNTPGMVRLPVCDPQFAWDNWFKFDDTTLDNYPCYIEPPPNMCEVSNFINQGSDASPKVEDCMQIVSQLQGSLKKWRVDTSGLKQKKLISYGSCRFGAQATNLHGNIYFHMGAQDVMDLITDAVNQFGGSGRIGAKGYLDCKGNINDQDIEWGVY